MDKKSNRLTPDTFWVKDEADIKEESEAEELFGSAPTEEPEKPAPADEPASEEAPAAEETESASSTTGSIIVPGMFTETAARTYAVNEDPEDDEDDEDEEPEDEIKKLIQLVVIIGGVILTIVLLAAIIIYFMQTKRTTTVEESTAWSESLSYESGEMWGVILSCEESVVTVYDAENQQTQVFDLSQAKNITDQYGQSMSVNLVKVGQVVQVQYNSANNQVEMFRLTSRSTDISNATGVIVQDDTVTINGTVYTIDEKLICLYQGQTYPVTEVSSVMVVNASAIDDHLYTLQVLNGSVWLEVQNIPKDYVGAELILTPEKGDEVVQLLSEESHTIEVPEGVLSYRIRKDNQVLEQGQLVAIGNGAKQVLTVNTTGSREGTVQFDINVTDGVTLTIDDLEYDVTEAIVLPYGEYTAFLQAEGMEAIEVDVNISQPYQVVKVDITAATTKVIISSSLSGTKLLINGEYQATLRGQSESFDLEAGTYIFLCQNDGYEDMVITMTVKPNMADQVIYFTGFQPVQQNVEDSESSSEDSAESIEE